MTFVNDLKRNYIELHVMDAVSLADGGGSGGKRIKINFSQAEDQANKLENLMEQLEEAISAAAKAGAAAVQGGGEGTEVGTAISEVIVAPAAGKLEKAKEQLLEMAQNLKKTGVEYGKKNKDLVGKIRALAPPSD